MKSLGDIPIPQLKSTNGWREVKIVENSEELVALSPRCPRQVSVDPKYHKSGLAEAMSECHVRETVARRLCKAARSLPPGWQVVVFDGWRPLRLQEELFSLHQKQLQDARPSAPPEEIYQDAQKYVSVPSSDLLSPSPHATGGSLDLSLKSDLGVELEMGTAFDSFDERAETRYYEKKFSRQGKLTPEEQAWLRNRRLLFHTLVAVGFTNYPAEWWHYDLGNQFWGRIKGKDAMYGLASLSEGGRRSDSIEEAP